MDVGRKVAPIVAARECEKEPDYCPRDFSTKEQRVAAVGRRSSQEEGWVGAEQQHLWVP